MLIGLCGKSGTGKSTLAKEIEKLGYKKVVTTTTRPRRKGEVDGVDYHFIYDFDFRMKEVFHSFIETTSYKVASGETWRYGTTYKDVENKGRNKVIILNPDGLRAFREKLIPIKVFLIESEPTVITARLADRGDNPAEIERRMEADLADFSNIEKLIDFTVYNERDTDIKELAKTIVGLAET